MRNLFQSFSLGGGALEIAVVSALLACLLAQARSAPVRWTGAVLVPLLLSYCLYWAPVWMGTSSDQYSSWAFLGVGAWWIAGVIASVIVMLVVRRRHRPPASQPPGPQARP